MMLHDCTQPTARDVFGVAIICAFPAESDTVEAIFNQFCEDEADYDKLRGDSNSYTSRRVETSIVLLVLLVLNTLLATVPLFTALDHLPLFSRWFQRLRCWYLSFFKDAKPSGFVRHPTTISPEFGGYLLLEHIERGEPLSFSWTEQHTNTKLRTNLFRGLAKILLALSRTSLPKIGSFIIDDSGLLQLMNRPLTLMVQDLENEGIPIQVPRNQTFSCVDSYVNALLACHDSRLKNQLNVANGPGDCSSQMCALALMRAIAPHYYNPSLNHGPFVFWLTDIHPSNILVDKDWNIKSIIDLEWAASLPIEFMQTPTWLTSEAVDVLNSSAYDTLRKEFMGIFEEEEEKCHATYGLRRASIMQNGWVGGTFWYTIALRSPTGLHAIFYNRIQPRYSESHFEDTNFFVIMCQYWICNAGKFIQSKVMDKEAYDERLREEFGQPP